MPTETLNKLTLHICEREERQVYTQLVVQDLIFEGHSCRLF